MASEPTSTAATGEVPAAATEAILVRSEEMPDGTPICRGIDFDQPFTAESLLASLTYTGFQATNVGLAIEEVNRMIKWRLSDEPVKDDEDEDLKDPKVRAETKCTIFLGYTSNMISSGVRETLRFIAKHRMVDVMVTTGGGIEEDFLKCLAPHYMGDFALKGRELRLKGMNRIGNLIVPNKNYCLFEDFFGPLLHKMHDEQERDGVVWTPSKMIHRMGKEINNPDSVYYWAYKNNIPVYCPAITDGSVGDMIFFHSYKRPGFVLDIAGDIRGMNDHALNAKKSGMLILGGGLVKHHICNANLMRNGADFSVFINTGHEFDGSDSGAKPDEAISWGKIRIDAKPVKVSADATIIFPLLASQTFVRHGTRLTHTDIPPVNPDAYGKPAAGAGAGAGAGEGASEGAGEGAAPSSA